MNYDAVLVVSFGGPESKEDVIPFLETVLRGRNVPRERLLTVAEHYYHFDGKSPINQQTRDLITALRDELERNGPRLPIYWGNRNWHPFLTETLQKMKEDGIQRALGFVTSAYSSYSGCRQYREDIARAQSAVGMSAREVDKLRAFFNHPSYIEATIERVKDALQQVPPEARQNIQVVYTAHSIPVAMAETSDYTKQLEEVRRLVSQALGWEGPGRKNDALVYQSRSGSPGQPWLGPDILEYLREVKARNLASAAVLAPIGFISDHMEVLYDLDVEAAQLCDSLELPMVRAKTVGVHPKFIGMIRELILERMNPAVERRALGMLGPRTDVCAQNCCPAPQQRSVRPSVAS
jgi:protoporphyrin/coproporphyrin ferrochelatase